MASEVHRFGNYENGGKMRWAEHVRWSIQAGTGGMSFGKPFFLAPDGTLRTESAYGVRFLFTGREWLAAVGLYDHRHRAYSPTLGRFLQVDPMASQARGETNPYLYCNNTPVWGFDPEGLRVIFIRGEGISHWEYIQLLIAFRRAMQRRTPCGELTRGAQYLRELADPTNPYLVMIHATTRPSRAGELGEGQAEAHVNVMRDMRRLEAELVHETAHTWAFSRRVYRSRRPDPEDPLYRAAERHATAVENQHRRAIGLPQRHTYGEAGTPWGFEVGTWP